MKHIILILASIICSILFAACSLTSCCKIYNLSDDELRWITNFQEGDRILLESEGEIDTITISETEINNKKYISIFDLRSCNWLEGQDEYRANAFMYFFLRHRGKVYNGSLSVGKISNEPNLSIIFRLANFFVLDFTILSTDVSTTFIEGENASYGMHQSEILNVKRVVWDKARGVTEITHSDNRTYRAIAIERNRK